jgi:hypothetical protein
LGIEQLRAKPSPEVMFEMLFRTSEHGLLMKPAERRDRLTKLIVAAVPIAFAVNITRNWR